MTSEAREFGQRQHRIELAALVSKPFAQPVSWALLAAAVPIALLIWPWLSQQAPAYLAAAGSYLLGLGLLFALWHLSAPTVEARAYQRAPSRWLLHLEDGGAAGAYAQLDRKQHVKLYSVWADPPGRGHGSELLRRIIADTRPAELELVANNRRVADFYRRHGFQDVRRVLAGHQMILPASPDTRHQTGHGEH